MFTRKINPYLIALLLTFAVIGTARSDDTPALLTEKAQQELHGYFQDTQWAGVKNVLGGSKAVILAPDVTSGAFIIGVEMGTGVLLVRHGEAWSDPVFVKLAQESAGFQAGIKESKVMMLVLTRNAIKDVVDGVSRVGGTGGFALGPLGVGGSGSGGISGGVQILTVATSEGLAAGTGISNMNINPAEELNTKAYGSGFNMNDVLSKPGGQLKAAGPLRELLAQATNSAWHD
jgi:lipid-binding SYLF domain-containing protein